MSTTTDHVPRDDRSRRLFVRAVELNESEWESFLLRECPDDPALRDEVLRILWSARQARLEGFLDQSTELEPALDPREIGKYKVVCPVSSEHTGQGIAYKAFDPDTDRHVVIKRYHEGTDPDASAQEARALAQVSSPYVAQCLGVERIGDESFLVVEHIPGRSLAEVRRDGPLDRAKVVKLMCQLAEGVSAVHARGLIHRDIKPANVILHDDGTPRLVDFGLAAPLCSDRLGRRGGSPMYMAPEQARTEKDRIDFRTDVFGLGGVLYELLTGHPPHEGESRDELDKQAREGTVIPPRAHDPKIPKALERICLKALAPAPENRYASANEFRQALRPSSNRNGCAVAITISVVLPCLALAAFSTWLMQTRRTSSPLMPLPPGYVANSVPGREDLRILDFEIMHYPKADQKSYRADLVRRIGQGSFGARFDDGVKIRAKLSEPAYSYLIAFAPDGSIVLCGPRDEAEAPRQSREPGLPAEPAGDTYYLTEGTGLQAFALVVSRDPLPPFAELVRKHGRPPWPAEPVPGVPGVVWRHDGQWLTTHDRDNTTGTRAVGQARRASGGGALVEELARWLRAVPGVDAVRVEAFTVEPAS